MALRILAVGHGRARLVWTFHACASPVQRTWTCVSRLVAAWPSRMEAHHDPAMLSDHVLRDIGLDRAQTAREAPDPMRRP